MDVNNFNFSFGDKKAEQNVLLGNKRGRNDVVFETSISTGGVLDWKEGKVCSICFNVKSKKIYCSPKTRQDKSHHVCLECFAQWSNECGGCRRRDAYNGLNKTYLKRLAGFNDLREIEESHGNILKNKSETICMCSKECLSVVNWKIEEYGEVMEDVYSCSLGHYCLAEHAKKWGLWTCFKCNGFLRRKEWYYDSWVVSSRGVILKGNGGNIETKDFPTVAIEHYQERIQGFKRMCAEGYGDFNYQVGIAKEMHKLDKLMGEWENEEEI